MYGAFSEWDLDGFEHFIVALRFYMDLLIEKRERGRKLDV